MTRLREQIVTPLGLDAAFAFVADFANSMHWDPGVATSERIDPGPVGVGARYRLGVRMGGRVSPMEYRISVFDAPTALMSTCGMSIAAADWLICCSCCRAHVAPLTHTPFRILLVRRT